MGGMDSQVWGQLYFPGSAEFSRLRFLVVIIIMGQGSLRGLSNSRTCDMCFDLNISCMYVLCSSKWINFSRTAGCGIHCYRPTGFNM